MDCELVSDSQPEKNGSGDSTTPVKTYSEYFRKRFSFYLSIGMTRDEYWNQDCTLVRDYKEAFDMKQERINEELWLQGFYNYYAFSAVSPLLHAFAKPGTEANPYLDEPLPRTEKEAKLREEKARELRFIQAKAKMEAMANKNKNKEI